jgi:hypothetical protein
MFSAIKQILILDDYKQKFLWGSRDVGGSFFKKRPLVVGKKVPGQEKSYS